jgi:hypothetical protein
MPDPKKMKKSDSIARAKALKYMEGPYQMTSTPSMSGKKLQKMQKQADSSYAAHQQRIMNIKGKLKK